MACINCGSGLHFECMMISEGSCCCKNDEAPVADDDLYLDEDDRKHSHGHKRDSTLKDQQSTGRKRAAIAYPLDRDAPCEWKGLRFAGGGQFPIVGCTNGKQEARHHGPDKNTLNNEEGNVHRICVFCHNRWHTLNDSSYEPGNPGPSHDKKTMATPDEIVDNELYWASKKTVKARD